MRTRIVLLSPKGEGGMGEGDNRREAGREHTRIGPGRDTQGGPHQHTACDAQQQRSEGNPEQVRGFF